MGTLKYRSAALAIALVAAWFTSLLPPREAHAAIATFSGRNSVTTSFFPLTTGLVTITYSTSSLNSFRVEVQRAGGQDNLVLVNSFGAPAGSAPGRITAEGSYQLVVSGGDDWTISVHQPRPTSAPPPPQQIVGYRNQITPFVWLERGPVRVRFIHRGSGSVNLAYVSMHDKDFLSSHIIEQYFTSSDFDHTRTATVLGPGVYFFRVIAASDWAIHVEQGASSVTGTPTAIPLPSLTPTRTLAPTLTPTPTFTSTPRPQPTCTPRPPVSVTAFPNIGALHVSIGATSQNNYLKSISFGAATNARIVTHSGHAGTGNFTAPLPDHPSSTQLSIWRLQPGAPVHVPITVTDGCGQWSTFVGAGVNAPVISSPLSDDEVRRSR